MVIVDPDPVASVFRMSGVCLVVPTLHLVSQMVDKAIQSVVNTAQRQGFDVANIQIVLDMHFFQYLPRLAFGLVEL